ncbi:hypothetical protein SKAU_G00060820 [Synaphobranchus kaupii]|uniref:Ig-like domain-containing protein n=1 Tax=Synaphobranchus kaupii TaxID=118154 RepID=A0A9Q1G4V2_SYNKA|nr:hypothetical protein SKAU_G00060820 [Synaphobranchus kaupii]
MPITIKKKLENCTAQEDGEVQLEVETSKPSLMKWRKSDVAVQPGGNMEIHVEGTKHSHFIKKISNTDQGYYSCETMDDKTEANLTVEKHPICIVKPRRVKIAMYKHKARLECQVSNANAIVKWYKGNEEIKPNKKYDLISNDVYRQLSINEVGFSDEDTYTCDAIDENASFQLLVEQQAFNIVRELRDVKVMEPSPAHFETEINIKSAKPPKWTLRGQLLKANHDVKMEKIDNVYHLIFKNTTTTMSGPLQFMVGKSKSVAQLVVFGKKQLFYSVS